MKRDVDDGLKVHRPAFARGRFEFPLPECGHGIGIQPGIHTSHQLNAVDRAILPDHSVEDHFAFDAGIHQRRRILRVYLVHRHGWICGTPGIVPTVALQQTFRGGLWGGDGFILQKLEGEGTAWIERCSGSAC